MLDIIRSTNVGLVSSDELWLPKNFFSDQYDPGDSGFDFGMDPKASSLNFSLLRFNALLREKRNGQARNFYKIRIFINRKTDSSLQIESPNKDVLVIESDTKDVELCANGDLVGVDLTTVPENLKNLVMPLVHHRMNKIGVKMNYKVQYLEPHDSVL